MATLVSIRNAGTSQPRAFGRLHRVARLHAIRGRAPLAHQSDKIGHALRTLGLDHQPASQAGDRHLDIRAIGDFLGQTDGLAVSAPEYFAVDLTHPSYIRVLTCAINRQKAPPRRTGT